MITLYDADRCPYCARVRIVLAEKGIEYETVEIDLDDRPAWIYEKNPLGRVPVLEEDTFVLAESAVIDEYLDDRYPDPPLWPADPAERALGRLLVFRFDELSKPYYALRRGEDGARERLDAALATLDAVLQAQRFLSGREFGLADIAYVPWILRATRPHGRRPPTVPGARRVGGTPRAAVVDRCGARRRRLVVKVLLLHAFPLDKGMWEPQRAALAGHEVIAPRLYGRGRTMDEWADSIAGETDGDLAVVGASMGGYCALALARRAPERVRGLLLVGARPDADSEERRAGREDTIELIRNEGLDGLWRMMLPKLFHDQSVADEQLVYRDADALVTALAAIRDREDSTDVVRSFAGPVQFVVGEFDPYVSAAKSSEFDVRELQGVGHLVNLERPDEFNEILREFVGSV